MRELLSENSPEALALGGLLIGMAFGWIVQRTNFCTMGSISDFMSFGDYRRFRAWILAAATALVGTQILGGLGIVELKKSMYLSPNLDWLGSILGGLLFGYGMVFAGGCASRNLVRAGGGDLRSGVVLLVMGIFAFMTIGGLLGPLRAELSSWTSLNLATRKLAATQGLDSLLQGIAGLPAERAMLFATAAVALLALVYCFKDRSFRSSPMHIGSGVGVGLCAVAGWALTGLAYDELAAQASAPISLTFVRPTGDTIDWLQRFTAARIPGFGVTSTLGTLVGAFLAARLSGRFQIATFTGVKDTRRNLFGAALMGIGGVVALGCTVGQAVTGVSTLALGSFLTFASIVVGGVVGIKRMEAILLEEI